MNQLQKLVTIADLTVLNVGTSIKNVPYVMLELAHSKVHPIASINAQRTHTLKSKEVKLTVTCATILTVMNVPDQVKKIVIDVTTNTS